MKSREYPILEHDPEKRAVIEPSRFHKDIDPPECCVLTFFQDVANSVCQKRDAEVVGRFRWEHNTHPLRKIEVRDEEIGVFQPGVGAAMSAGMLEELIGAGCERFIVCGAAGVLNDEIDLGHIIIPSSAVRDEGTSYHYIQPSREISMSGDAMSVLESLLEDEKKDYTLGKTWTTDAPYRETVAKTKMRREEGCLSVEMEASALFAVAQFREVPLGQLLYAGDLVSPEGWRHRNWHRQKKIREELFWLSVKACQEL